MLFTVHITLVIRILWKRSKKLRQPLRKQCGFSLRISSVNVTIKPAVLVTFSEKIHNGKHHFICSKGGNISQRISVN